ncbi:MAG: hypothetical protein K0R50_3526 [Eubacterium sp.]|jgi:hypothetical protein|nr:hypothetical protein [Eubacterium sp.]
MEIEFDLNKQDYIDFNIFHAMNSDTVKKSLVIQRYLAPIIFLIVPFLIAGLADLPLIYWMCVFIVIGAVWIIFYPKYFKAMILKRVAKILDEGKNEDLWGKHRVIVNEEGLLEQSKNGENKINWNGVERIVSLNQHFFIYISSVSACIIPKRAFKTNEDTVMFYEFITKHINSKN